MNIKLRPWQRAALEKALDWLVNRREDRCFLINVAPGAGKTVAACALAQSLFERDEIDRVIVIAPRAEVVDQWAADYKKITGREMTKLTPTDSDAYGMDICATWSAIKGLMEALQAVCRKNRVLVICDEHHHAAVEAAWGRAAGASLADAKFALILTGTPIRSDGESTTWLAYDDAGKIDHPEDGTYTLTYGEAVDLGYCRPATFHRHEGKFQVDLGGEKLKVSGHQEAKLPNDLGRIPALQRALDFYRLACTRLFEEDGETPLCTGYQGTMLDHAGRKLTDLRCRMPNAGGLVIAPNIEMAQYMARLLEMLEQQKPMLVHSRMRNPDRVIKAFRNSDQQRWLVSVAMVSEGVDIPRLRVLVYLPNALTELAFRQSVGRVVRTMGPGDDTRAYVLIPSFDILERLARRVEDEMPAITGGGDDYSTKRCPICHSECERGAKICDECGYEFPVAPPPKLKGCSECGALNPLSAKSCRECGATFGEEFVLTLKEALRDGAIIRGMDLDEEEVILGEEMAPAVRESIMKSGDEKLLHVLKILPEESFARLHNFMQKAAKKD